MASPVVRKGRKKYWCVGFQLDSLQMVQMMSGLVQIYGVEYTENVVWFYLKSLDKTGILFREGVLRGTPLDGPPPVVPQQLLVVLRTPCPVRHGLDVLS
jgi:hypothetical protein